MDGRFFLFSPERRRAVAGSLFFTLAQMAQVDRRLGGLLFLPSTRCLEKTFFLSLLIVLSRRDAMTFSLSEQAVHRFPALPSTLFVRSERRVGVFPSPFLLV